MDDGSPPPEIPQPKQPKKHEILRIETALSERWLEIVMAHCDIVGWTEADGVVSATVIFKPRPE